MASEKISKAYFWRSGSPPPRTHAGFTKFMRFLAQPGPGNRDQIANIFTVKRFSDFRSFVRKILPLAYELEVLAPALAGNGPNPEYPWPHERPTVAPTNFSFPIWSRLYSEPNGRNLLKVIRAAVRSFDQYADL
jgi:hypothetical protein